MTQHTLIRLSLLTAAVLFLLLCILLPLIRLRVRAGVWGLFGPKTPIDQVVHAGLRLLVIAFMAWVIMVQVFDLSRLDVWRVPLPVTIGGITLAAGGLALVALAQAQMGLSWRIGIDESPTGLVTKGLFKVSRNPIYMGVLVSLLGLVLLTPSPWTICFFTMAALVISLVVRTEEEHLYALHGETFMAYAVRVGRFFPFCGRLSA